MAVLDFPSSPTVGQIYTANGRAWIWTGIVWNSYSTGIPTISASDGPPANAVPNQMWYESDTGKTFIFYDNFWVDITAPPSTAIFGSVVPETSFGLVPANGISINSARSDHTHGSPDGKARVCVTRFTTVAVAGSWTTLVPSAFVYLSSPSHFSLSGAYIICAEAGVYETTVTVQNGAPSTNIVISHTDGAGSGDQWMWDGPIVGTVTPGPALFAVGANGHETVQVYLRAGTAPNNYLVTIKKIGGT